MTLVRRAGVDYLAFAPSCYTMVDVQCSYRVAHNGATTGREGYSSDRVTENFATRRKGFV